MTLCKQQGANVSHNVPNPHSNPNRINSEIQFKVKLWVTLSGYSVWNVLLGRVDKMEAREKNGRQE